MFEFESNRESKKKREKQFRIKGKGKAAHLPALLGLSAHSAHFARAPLPPFSLCVAGPACRRGRLPRTRLPLSLLVRPYLSAPAFPARARSLALSLPVGPTRQPRFSRARIRFLLSLCVAGPGCQPRRPRVTAAELLAPTSPAPTSRVELAPPRPWPLEPRTPLALTPSPICAPADSLSPSLRARRAPPPLTIAARAVSSSPVELRRALSPGELRSGVRNPERAPIPSPPPYFSLPALTRRSPCSRHRRPESPSRPCRRRGVPGTRLR